MSDKKKIKIKAIIIAAALLVAAAGVAIALILILNGGSDTSSTPDASSDTSDIAVSSEIVTPEPETVTIELASGSFTVNLSDIPQGNLSDWNLILLNPEPENKIDKELDVELVQRDNQKGDARAVEWYDKMNEALEADGVAAGDLLYFRSGYRTIALQKTYYDYNYNMYIKQGKTPEEARRLTLEYYTEPGHSEHHSGLAFDITTPNYQKEVYTLDDRFAQTDTYTWLVENAADYGFILRYPKDKEAITQIKFEPWHYRYVGTEHAKFMKEHNLCLEEYIELLTAAGR